MLTSYVYFYLGAIATMFAIKDWQDKNMRSCFLWGTCAIMDFTLMFMHLSKIILSIGATP